MITLKNRTILVVEDDEMNFIYISHILRLTQCNVRWAKTGLDAIEEVEKEPFADLILMDLQLPDMTGEQAASAIRARGHKVPVIAQTASKSNYDRDLLAQSGCNDFIAKPYGVDDLLKLIGKYI